MPGGTVRVGDRATRAVREIDASSNAEVRYEGFHHGASYLELAAFAAAVRTGAPPAVTVDDGLWSVATGAAAHRSIELGRPVFLDEL